MHTCGNTALIVMSTHIHKAHEWTDTTTPPTVAQLVMRGDRWRHRVTDVLDRASWETTNLNLTNKRRLQAESLLILKHGLYTNMLADKLLHFIKSLKTSEMLIFLTISNAGTLKLTSLQAAIWLMYSPSVKMMFCPSECWSTGTQSEDHVILLYSTSITFLLRKGFSPYQAWWPRPRVLESQGWSWWPTCCGCSCPDTTSAPEDTTQTQLPTDNSS